MVDEAPRSRSAVGYRRSMHPAAVDAQPSLEVEKGVAKGDVVLAGR